MSNLFASKAELFVRMSKQNCSKVIGKLFSGGANGQVNNMRIMNPNSSNPNGYIRYMNSNGQGVNPYTGQTGSHSTTHFPIK